MEELDPEKVRKAKEAAAGSLGQQLAKFPLRFAKAVFFGKPPKASATPDINNGTISFIDFGKGPVGITCSHVLQAYRDRLSSDSQTVFQVGHFEFNPLDYIIAESEELDLATINLSDGRFESIKSEGDIGNECFRPAKWPPGSIAAENYVAFAGFPGAWRKYLSRSEIVFDSFSSGACRVGSVAEDHFVCQFERTEWVKTADSDARPDLHDLGGMSGGSVFILRELNWEFMGIIYDFSPKFDLMHVRLSNLINTDGKIDD
ncbi:hypothetical protein ACFL2T_02685 [Elusimicrobiota bacterium]